MSIENYNVAQALADRAAQAPFRPAIVFPAGRDKQGRALYTQLNFRQLDELCDSYAHGLTAYGIRQGERVLMMVRPGVEFVALTFALVKMGAAPAFIDPGMPRRAFLQCVREIAPTAFIGIPLAHVLRLAYSSPFKSVQHFVTVGKRWFWNGATLDELQSTQPEPFPIAPTTTESEAAITFTSGSTGIPKGVVYLQGMFKAQIELLRSEFNVGDNEIDLPGLSIFALFNPTFGITTIFPDMDYTHPAKVNPAYIVEAIQTFGVTNSFGSPTIWKRVGSYCLEHAIQLPSLKRIVMAGAPVPPWLIRDFTRILAGGDVYTPFGATEALPLTMMSGQEILAETAALSDTGSGVCVGRPVRGITIRIIQITEEPIPEWDDKWILPQGQIGEIVVKGPVVTRLYLNRPQQTAQAKMQDHDGVWHRMGDLGYFDDKGRLWFCGRKSHRVEAASGLLLPVPCEAIFNQHPAVARSALVGVGERGQQRPIIIIEPRPGQMPRTEVERQKFIAELLALGAHHAHTREIREVLFHPDFPVDVRHNAKIQREKLAVWAEAQLI